MKLAVLISGRGSNMMRLADHTSLDPGLEIVLVAANTACAGIGLAADRGLRTELVDRADYSSRQAHESALGDAIVASGADLVCLAGYMAILSADFVRRFEGRIVNIHPSLLPDLKGLDTHERALVAGMTRHGASVHIVTADLDDGPVLLQAALGIDHADDAQTLAARVLRLEHALYPFVLSSLANGDLTIRDGKAFWHDGKAALARAGDPICDRLRHAVIWPDQDTDKRPGQGQTRN